LTNKKTYDNIKSVTITDFVTRKKKKKEAYTLFKNKEDFYYGKVCM